MSPCGTPFLGQSIATPNGDFEFGYDWGGPGFPADAGDPEGVGGSYFSFDIGVGSGGFLYTGWSGVTFTAGVTYVARVWIGGASGGTVIGFGRPGDRVEQGVVQDAVNCIQWTPATTTTAAEFYHSRAGSGTLSCDNLRAYRVIA